MMKLSNLHNQFIWRIVFISVLSLLICMAQPSNAQSNRPQSTTQDKRVALIIGNSAYRYIGELDNPTNDAQGLAVALRQLGFIVIHKADLNKRGMEQALQEFAQQLRGANLGLFFYAGHGMQYQGQNFLVSVAANPDVGERAILSELITAERVLQVMEQAKVPSKIIILDACRNNPIFKSGLAMMQPEAEYGGGTFIAYSTQPNKTAADGTGRHSPYTENLLLFIKEPNVPIEVLFKKVATAVRDQTQGEQIPWVSSALLGGDLCLAGCFVSTASVQDNDYCTTQVGKGLYQGECKNGLPHGQGVMKYKSGEYYQGSFVNGVRHGQGVQYLPDGDEIAGSFCNGKLCN